MLDSFKSNFRTRALRSRENAERRERRSTSTKYKAAYYPHIARIPDLESQHGDPDHPPKFNQLFLISYGRAILKLSSKSTQD